MKSLACALAATLAAGIFAAAPTTANAERADNPPGTCASPEAVTQDEVDKLVIGMRRFQVLDILGSRGYRSSVESTDTHMVRQWLYCYADGSTSRQGVIFDRSAAGHWVVSDVG